MVGSSPSPPPAPDPTTVSNAQTASNKQTAQYNFGLNNPNVNTPLGSSTFSVGNTTPTYDYNAYYKALDAAKASQGSGDRTLSPEEILAQKMYPNAPVNTNAFGYKGSQAGAAMPTLDQFKISDGGNPQVTQDITLSPGQQQLLDQQTQQSIGLSNLANQLQNGVGASLSQPQTTPADINALSAQARDAYYKQEASYLDPQFQVSDEQLASKLANQGIMPGSEAYKTAMDQQARNKTFAYNNAQQQAITAGPQNAQALFGLSTAARDQPLTEFNALRTGSQPQMYNAAPVNQVSANPTDVAGNIWKSYGADQNTYNQQVASNNQTTQGLFGLAGSGLGAYGQYAGMAALAGSDIRFKEAIEPIGSENGIPTYHFRYKGKPETYHGVMAQDILESHPEAIHKIDGMYYVDYKQIGIDFRRVS